MTDDEKRLRILRYWEARWSSYDVISPEDVELLWRMTHGGKWLEEVDIAHFEDHSDD